MARRTLVVCEHPECIATRENIEAAWEDGWLIVTLDFANGEQPNDDHERTVCVNHRSTIPAWFLAGL